MLKTLVLILTVSLFSATALQAADHECLVKRQYRYDNSNTGQVETTEQESQALAVPARGGEQAHRDLVVAGESYLLYVWNTSEQIQAQLTFEREGNKEQLGLALPTDGGTAQAFKYFQKALDDRGIETETVTVSLVCRKR